MARKNKKKTKTPASKTIGPNEDEAFDKKRIESNKENTIEGTQNDRTNEKENDIGNNISTNCIIDKDNNNEKAKVCESKANQEELCTQVVMPKSESPVEKATEVPVNTEKVHPSDSKHTEQDNKLKIDKNKRVEVSKQKCLPWTTKEVPGRGKRLIATRTIKPLEIVIADSAVVTVPVGKMSCVGCGRCVNCAYSCPSCLLPLCGSGCPRAEVHKIECSLLGKCIPKQLTIADTKHPIFSAVGVVRFLHMKHEEPDNYFKLDGLDPQIERIKADSSASKLLCDIKDLLKHLDYKEEDIDHAYGLLKLYGYNLPDLPDGKVRSIFPIQSLLTHSCLPNLQYIEKEGGRRIVLQATTKIEKGDLLTVRYTPFLQGRISLTKWLKEKRYISCKCPRCVDGTELGTFTSSALCDKKECKERGGLYLPLDPVNRSEWICSACQALVSQEKVEEIEDEYITKFRQLPQGDLNEYYRFLNELGDRFHASHHLVMRMAHFLILLQGKRLESLSRERIETQSVLCDKLLVYVSRLDPGATQTRAKLLLEKNKADLNLAKLDCEAGRINRKVFMAKIKEGVRVEVNAKKILYFKWEDN